MATRELGDPELAGLVIAVVDECRVAAVATGLLRPNGK
jgi:hypothetical protein